MTLDEGWTAPGASTMNTLPPVGPDHPCAIRCVLDAGLPVITLPPMPVARDFEDGLGGTKSCYHDALAAWKVVCLAIVTAPGRGTP